MRKNGIDPKITDFIWNKNRLQYEKDTLKQNMLKVISKPVKKNEGEDEESKEPKQKIDKNSVAIN